MCYVLKDSVSSIKPEPCKNDIYYMYGLTFFSLSTTLLCRLLLYQIYKINWKIWNGNILVYLNQYPVTSCRHVIIDHGIG